MRVLQPATLAGKYKSVAFAGFAILFLLSLWSLEWPAQSFDLYAYVQDPAEKAAFEAHYASAVAVADQYRANPVDKSQFGEMGTRLKTIRGWIEQTGNAHRTRDQKEKWTTLIEEVAGSMLPFIQSPNSSSITPLKSLRSSFVRGTKGLVITTGKKRFRYACHLVSSLRQVLKSRLPIQIAYSGEDDLPEEYRDFITGLESDVSTFDVTTVFNDSTLDLGWGGWAVKAFAVLGSTFEQAILLDADDVFFQPPEAIFDEDPQYLETGTLLFHDRLLWQGAFKERHAWWGKQLENTNLSETIKHSKVYMEGYAEEGDSGVVTVDKSRLGVFIGLLHIAWQNTKDVREAYTYTQGYGDKESWWFGFELTETPYSMEPHYAAIVGHVKLNQQGHEEKRVCSFTIAHVDHRDRLLWFNGSLLRNKENNPMEFDVPSEWMIDATWEKGASKQDMSCMSGGEVRQIDVGAVDIVQRSVELAKKTDELMREKIPGSLPWFKLG
ncbi:mannosyltransferase putative-domain-containing protein [Exophiala viscosa]|uniref:Mannosyltransferase putative-domain-containing protein n=1 Tax=Exophiala viscosa TaxID=2486360 RepID=A0AAN6DYB1_9EURO|nr:mannosyltransferase putative-domain-containing protein [Exophiala viscosa]